jgi:hypothetical protein
MQLLTSTGWRNPSQNSIGQYPSYHQHWSTPSSRSATIPMPSPIRSAELQNTVLHSYRLSAHRAGIFKQSMGARNRVGIELSYRSARLHRLAEFIPWNRFLGSIQLHKRFKIRAPENRQMAGPPRSRVQQALGPERQDHPGMGISLFRSKFWIRFFTCSCHHTTLLGIEFLSHFGFSLIPTKQQVLHAASGRIFSTKAMLLDHWDRRCRRPFLTPGTTVSQQFQHRHSQHYSSTTSTQVAHLLFARPQRLDQATGRSPLAAVRFLQAKNCQKKRKITPPLRERAARRRFRYQTHVLPPRGQTFPAVDRPQTPPIFALTLVSLPGATWHLYRSTQYYTINLVFVQGRSNVMADALSRPISGIAATAAAPTCIAITVRIPFDLGDMAPSPNPLSSGTGTPLQHKFANCHVKGVDTFDK